MPNKQTYADKLNDQRWQEVRKRILSRDRNTCQLCFNNEVTLHVHHHYYEKDTEPWDYDDCVLVSLCEKCHAKEDYFRENHSKDGRFLLRQGFMRSDISEIENILSVIINKKGKHKRAEATKLILHLLDYSK